MSTKEEDIHKALNRAYFYLKFRPRTKQEVRLYLQEKSEKFYRWSFDVIETVLRMLEKEGLIDDRKFIEAFVASRIAIKPKGEFVLLRELMRLGVGKDLLEEYFSQNPQDEEELAKKALWSRWPQFKKLDKKNRFKKAAQFLLRRGFSFSIAKKVIERFEEV